MTHRQTHHPFLPSLALAALALLCAAAPALALGPPTVESTSFSAVGETDATLEATIDTKNVKVPVYHFQYVDLATFEASGFAEALSTADGAPLAGSTEPVSFSAQITGLAPGSAYRFRVFAENSKHEATQGPTASFSTFASPPAFTPCPENEPFRSGPSALLPDCRAYEQATPIDKNGANAAGLLAYSKAAAQGDAIAFAGASDIPGAVGAQEFPSYLASRGGGEWATHGMLAPASAGQDAAVLGWSPDFSEVFTKATILGQPSKTALLATPGTGGVPTVVVDYTSGLEPSIAASASDGSLLFESPIALAPGAVPGKPNLYLWERGSGQLTLAGAMNDGKAPDAGAIAGPYDWVGGTNPSTLSRGGATRKYYTQDEHVLSADGTRAYFTAAGTGRLYARLNPAAPQSPLDGEGHCTDAAEACTVELSASEKTNGAGPGGTELGGPHPAAFQAASKDGQIAYFSSEEELTNDANTGPEPPEAPPPATISRAKLGASGAEEIEHSCVPARATSLSADATHLYWAAPTEGAIGRANLDCTEADFAFITGLSEIGDLVVEGDHLYWTEPAAGAIGRATLDGSGNLIPGSVEADFIAGADRPLGIAAGCGHLYWTEPGDESENETHFLGRATLGPGGAEDVDQEFIKFADGGDRVPGKGVAVDCAGGHIYVVKIGIIKRFNLDGSKAYICESEEGCIRLSALANEMDLALDATHLYWSREGSGALLFPSAIGRADLSDLSGANREFIKESEGVEHAQSLAVAGEHVYWANDPPASTKPGNDLYRYDFGAPAGQRLSDVTPDLEKDGAGVQGVLGTSADGSVVYFAANGVLSAAPNGAGETAQPGDCSGRPGSASGHCNLYRWQAGLGEPAFLAPLDVGGGSQSSNSDAMNWAAKAADLFEGQFQKTSRVSADGKTLLFRSQERLTPYDNTPPSGACGSQGSASVPCSELYRFNTEEGVACVSCDPTGTAPAGSPDLGNAFLVTSSEPGKPAAVQSRNLSADGTRAFFETPEALVGADTNGASGCPLVGDFSVGNLQHRCEDVYEWEAPGAGTCNAASSAYLAAEGGCIYLLSSGHSKEPALLADASESGDDVFFFSLDRLLGSDGDQLNDIYDARVGGGLASQNLSPPSPCESAEACRSAVAPASGAAPCGSACFSGPGDVVQKPRCPKGSRLVRRRGKARCLKPRHKAGHRHRAGRQRGAGR